MDGSGADCRICSAWNVAQFLLESRKRKRIHLKKAEEIRQKYSTENEVEKARAMMEALEQESKEEIEE